MTFIPFFSKRNDHTPHRHQLTSLHLQPDPRVRRVLEQYDCYHDDARCSYFRSRLDPNRKKKMEDRHIRDVHGLLVCNGCSRLWNRDVNAPLNMNRIARACLEELERPLYLQRKRGWNEVPTVPKRQCCLPASPDIASFLVVENLR